MSVSQRIKNLREAKKLSLRVLASSSGISPATLSLIESGKTSPSVATLEKISDGLDVNVAEFFIEKRSDDAVEIFSLAERPAVRLGVGSRLTPLASQYHRTGFEPILVVLEPGGKFNDDFYWLNTPLVYAWVRSGKAVLKYEGRSFSIQETFSVYYNPREPHNWLNESDRESELLIVRSL